jgi:hypothetical protein
MHSAETKRRHEVFDLRASGDNINSFALLRVGLSSVLIFKLLYELPDFADLYGAHGLLPWWTNELSAPSHVPTLGWLCSVVNSFRVSVRPETVALAVLGVYAGALVLLLVGYWQRAPAIAVCFCHFVFVSSNRFTLYGADAFASIGIFYIMLGPATANHFAWTGSKPPHEHDFRALLLTTLLRVQMCIVYAETGWTKALGREWWSGDSLWRTLRQPQFHGVIGTQWLGNFPTLLQISGICVVVVEVAYPLAMWIRKVRTIELFVILLMHIIIMFALGLWAFGAEMIVLNLAAFGIPALQDLQSILPSFVTAAAQKHSVATAA